MNIPEVKWLVELDVFDDNQEALLKAIKDMGYNYKTLQYIPFDDDLVNRVSKLFNENDCVVFYGSLNFGHKLKKISWIPGVYLNDKALKCSSYYSIFKKDLLHENYWMLPFGDLINKKEQIFEYFDLFQKFSKKDQHGKIFIRPDSNSKEFTGMICDWDSFEDNIKLAGFYDVEPDMQVLISFEIPLLKEWRFVIVDGEPISGSLYRDWSRPEKLQYGHTTKDYVLMHSHSVAEECEDLIAWEKAKQWAKMYNPDKCWTMDIVKTEKLGYKLLEIGCFSCAGLYGNNLNKVVKSVSESALKEWKEYFYI